MLFIFFKKEKQYNEDKHCLQFRLRPLKKITQGQLSHLVGYSKVLGV